MFFGNAYIRSAFVNFSEICKVAVVLLFIFLILNWIWYVLRKAGSNEISVCYRNTNL